MPASSHPLAARIGRSRAHIPTGRHCRIGSGAARHPRSRPIVTSASRTAPSRFGSRATCAANDRARAGDWARYKQVVHRLPLKIIAGLTPNSAVDVVWAGLSVLDHERSYGGAFALSRLDSVEPAQVGLQALRRDIDADVAAISRFGEENMRIVRTQGIDALLRPGLRADRGADKLRGDRR